MLKLVLLATVQSLFLVSSQIFMKLAMQKIDKVEFSWQFISAMLKNYHFALSGVAIAFASTIWMYILKKYEFSTAYPMISISYIFGLVAAYYIFKENIPFTRWLGVFVIILGIILITRK